jgi:hypothetical protein
MAGQADVDTTADLQGEGVIVGEPPESEGKKLLKPWASPIKPWPKMARLFFLPACPGLYQV